MNDSDRIGSYYDDLVARYGADPRAVDASSEQSLAVRYEVLGAVADLNGKSVLDVGCGHGGLGRALLARYPDVHYAGIDLSGGMVETVRRLQPQLDVRQLDLRDLEDGERHDVVLAQGIFYLLRSDAERTAEALVAKMFAVAREAVAFTAISTWSPHRDPSEFYVDPEAMLRHCRSLTSRVVLRHDYHPGDVAFYLFKKETPS